MKELLTHPIKWVREFTKICLDQNVNLEVNYNTISNVLLEWGYLEISITSQDRLYIEVYRRRIPWFPITGPGKDYERIFGMVEQFRYFVPPQGFLKYIQALKFLNDSEVALREEILLQKANRNQKNL